MELDDAMGFCLITKRIRSCMLGHLVFLGKCQRCYRIISFRSFDNPVVAAGPLFRAKSTENNCSEFMFTRPYSQPSWEALKLGQRAVKRREWGRPLVGLYPQRGRCDLLLPTTTLG